LNFSNLFSFSVVAAVSIIVFFDRQDLINCVPFDHFCIYHFGEITDSSFLVCVCNSCDIDNLVRFFRIIRILGY
ncbi:MAG: hypothetical protein ACKN9K_20510, partial [Dolichospermum sp.]